MDSWKSRIFGIAAMTALAFVASCDNGPSAVETRARTDAPANFEPAGNISSTERDAPFADARGDRAAAEVGGRPLWSSNRKYSAAQNADYHFKRDGRDFGARSVDAYVAQAHAFISKPPRGTLTLTRRNGDRLYYDPAGNTFVVASRAGAPRTMFKPREGMAYWEKQKARETGRRASRGRSRDDNGEG
jgi:pyocin large subunit-like protein